MTNNPIVTAITGYVEEHRSELLSKAMLDGRSRRAFNLMTDVKGPTALNILGTNVVFGELQCGWNEQGSTEYSQRILEPKALSVNMGFCDKKLLQTWAQYEVKVAAGFEELPFEEQWTKQILDSINEQIEHMLYFGSGTGAEFKGIVPILSGESGTVKVNAAEGASAYDFLKDVAKAIPVQVKNPVILVSTALYREFMQDLVAANLFHYDSANGEGEYKLPGTDIRVIGVDGLNDSGSTVAIAANMSNLFYGVSADEDSDTFDLWYSKDNREFRLAVNFIAGTQVAFPSEVVLGVRA
ncbi:MAG: hypothetical protein KIG63_07470 [Methanobrevibacter sp.]|nr:hypothetical protein [Methanobrevibacter sp.]